MSYQPQGPYNPQDPTGAQAYQPAGAPPSANWGWAIASLILCWPFCIPSFIFASRVSGFWTTGNVAAANDASANAKKWGRIGVIVGIIIYVLIFIMVGCSALLVAMAPQG